MITLYAINCPNCRIQEKYLQNAGVAYAVCKDISVMKSLGITKVPMLAVNGQLMNMQEAIRYIQKEGANS